MSQIQPLYQIYSVCPKSTDARQFFPFDCCSGCWVSADREDSVYRLSGRGLYSPRPKLVIR